MADVDFNECTRRVLAHEGGYGWDKRDPGGPTNFGITYIDYAGFEHEPVATAAAWAPRVKAMPLADAMSIYRGKYWNGMRCAELPAGVDYCVYDYGINSGVARPAHVAQKLLKLPMTGRIDDATVKGLKTVDPDKFIDAIDDERLAFMHAIRGGTAWDAFGKGWGTRVAEVRSVSHIMSKNGSSASAATAAPAPTIIPAGQMAKATHIDPAAVNAAATKATGGAAIGAGAAGASHSTHGSLLLTGAAVGAVVVIAGVAFYLVKRGQQTRQATVILPANVDLSRKAAA